MKTINTWAAACLGAAGLLLAQAPPTRQGRYWAQTITGSAPVPPGGRLQVLASAEVSLRGEKRSDVAYWLTKRIPEEKEAVARRQLEQLRLETFRRGDTLVLSLGRPVGSRCEAWLRLSVPKNLRQVHIASQAGSIEVEDLAGGLDAETGAGHIRIAGLEGALAARTGGGSVWLEAINGSVRCISGGGRITAQRLAGAATLITAGGEVAVREATGRLQVRSGGGNIRVEKAASLEAVTAGGSIEVLEASGPVRAETGAGAIRVRGARGLQAGTASGTIQLDNVSGAVQALAGLGQLLVRLAGPIEDSRLSTGAGDITVFIPSNLAVNVEALSQASPRPRILSEFPEIKLLPRAQAVQARGSLNGGGPRLRLSASGGTIHLRKVAAAGLNESTEAWRREGANGEARR